MLFPITWGPVCSVRDLWSDSRPQFPAPPLEVWEPKDGRWTRKWPSWRVLSKVPQGQVLGLENSEREALETPCVTYWWGWDETVS